MILGCPQMANVPVSISVGLYDKQDGKQRYGIDTRCAVSDTEYSAVASKQGSDRTYYKTGQTFGVDRGHLNPSGKWKPVCSELLNKKTRPSALSSYISMRECSKTRE